MISKPKSALTILIGSFVMVRIESATVGVQIFPARIALSQAKA